MSVEDRCGYSANFCANYFPIFIEVTNADKGECHLTPLLVHDDWDVDQ